MNQTLLSAFRLLLVVLCVSFQLVAAEPAKPPSPEMARIIMTHLVGYELEVDSLPQIPKAPAPDPKIGKWETYHMPPPRGKADLYEYFILLNYTEQSYWITRIGGVAGTNTTYGPVQLKSESTKP